MAEDNTAFHFFKHTGKMGVRLMRVLPLPLTRRRIQRCCRIMSTSVSALVRDALDEIAADLLDRADLALSITPCRHAAPSEACEPRLTLRFREILNRYSPFDAESSGRYSRFRRCAINITASKSMRKPPCRAIE